jgi:spermidine/putrescine transport system permease protein
MGIMANPKKVFGSSTITQEQLSAVRADMKSWGVLWNEKATGHDAVTRDYKNKISMKDVARDSYTVALLYKIDEIEKIDAEDDDEDILTRIMQEPPGAGTGSNRFREVARNELRDQKPLLFGYEISAGKDRMADTRLNHLPAIGMYWSSDAVAVMPKNKDLEFYVPDAGSALWVDTWVMPKYAKNKSMALKFLDFISEKDNAVRIMKHTNSASAVTDARTQYYNELKDQYAEEQEWVERYLVAMFPPLDRCRLFRYLGETGDNAISRLWDDIKK